MRFPRLGRHPATRLQLSFEDRIGLSPHSLDTRKNHLETVAPRRLPSCLRRSRDRRMSDIGRAAAVVRLHHAWPNHSLEPTGLSHRVCLGVSLCSYQLSGGSVRALCCAFSQRAMFLFSLASAPTY